MKWIVKNTGVEFNGTVEYSVREQGKPEWDSRIVFYDKSAKRANCTECSGPLSAMLSTCKHALAVKRFIIKDHGTEVG